MTVFKLGSIVAIIDIKKCFVFVGHCKVAGLLDLVGDYGISK